MRLLTFTAIAILTSAAAAAPNAALIEHQEDRADRELEAHREEVRAANQMVDLTRWQIFLGWLTVAGLAGSLILTQRALRQTRESLDLSHLVAREELRAHVPKPRFSNVTDLGDSVRFNWNYENKGLTAARSMRIGGTIQYVGGRPFRFPLEQLICDEMLRVDDLAPGDGRLWFIETQKAEFANEWANVQAGTGSFVIRVRATFTDMFGGFHEVDHSEIRWGHDLQHSHDNRDVDGDKRAPPP